MATTNLARFTINGTPSEDANGKRGYDAGAGEVLAITLEANPALGVLTITYDIFDSTKTTSPLNSLYASNLTFTENGLKTYNSSTTNTTVHITIPPAADISSYTIRATAVTAIGAQIFERLVCVRKNGLRMTIPGESLQYAQRGWSDALNELTKILAEGGTSVPIVSESNVGTIAAFPSAQRRIFHSDGSTDGGSWSILELADLNSALAASSIDRTKLSPGPEGYVLKTVGGSVVWDQTTQGDTGDTGPTGPGYLATSSTTFTPIGEGASRTIATQNGLAFALGDYIRVTSRSELTCWSEGVVTSYAGTSLTWNDTLAGPGATSKSDWNISIRGTVGSTGPTGPIGPGYLATSSTSLEITVGSKTFIIQPNLAYQPSDRGRLSTGYGGAFMEGYIVSYNVTTGEVVMNVTEVGGAGIGSSWTFGLVGRKGDPGDTGPSGASYGTLGPWGANQYDVGATGGNLQIMNPSPSGNAVWTSSMDQITDADQFEIYISRPCTITGGYFAFNSSMNGDVTFRIWKNGNTNIASCVVTAGDTAGQLSGLSLSLNVGDTIYITNHCDYSSTTWYGRATLNVTYP